jgi:GDP-4-dehydro-6-deoxy-D-mannose reductase
MKRALVTGATGFIGRAVVARLEAEGWYVVRAVRTSQGDAAARSIVLGPAPWDQATFAAAIESARPDVVFHLAGTTRARNAAEMYNTNTGLAASLLDAVAASAIRPAVILAGSAAEYGNLPAEYLPAREDGPCQPITDYGISKFAQTLLGLARAGTGIAVLVARIFNPLGAGMPSHLALASFAEQLRRKTGRLSVGDLDVARDFIGVDEAARLIVALAGDPKNYGRVYNICSGTAVPLRQLVEELVRQSEQTVQIVIDPDRLRPGEARALFGDTARLRAAGLSVKPPDFAPLLANLVTGQPMGRR